MTTHYNRSQLLSAFIWAVLFAFSMSFVYLWVWFIHDKLQLRFEKDSKSESWFTYDYVKPSKDVFETWEKITFLSSVHRYEWLYVQWQDTPYCIDKSWFSRKLQTQYWPLTWTQWMDKWDYMDKKWEYYTENIQTWFISCMMCWTTVWYTPLWKFPKTQSYCTEWFWVNGNH